MLLNRFYVLGLVSILLTQCLSHASTPSSAETEENKHQPHMTPTQEREDLLRQLAQQTGDEELFMAEQARAFDAFSNELLKDVIWSQDFKDALSQSKRSDCVRQYEWSNISRYKAVAQAVKPHWYWQEGRTLQIRATLLFHLNFEGADKIDQLSIESPARFIVLPPLTHMTNLRALRLSANPHFYPKIDREREYSPPFPEPKGFEKRLSSYVDGCCNTPPNLQGLTALETLTIWGSWQRRAPNLQGLTNLSNIDFMNNSLADAPDFSCCPLLEVLNLKRNRLTNIRALSLLTKLTLLQLDENHLTRIDDILGLTSLTYLDLKDNQLGTIPSGITALQSLGSLYLGQNRLRKLAPVGKLTNLTWLWLEKNYLTSVRELEGLPKLHTLKLDHNELTSLQGLETLTTLSWLCINSTGLKTVTELHTLTQLKSLEAEKTAFSELPPLAGFTNLTRLTLDPCFFSDKYPQLIADLRALLNPFKDRLYIYTTIGAYSGGGQYRVIITEDKISFQKNYR